jgi:hypothetical protein
MLTQLDNLSRTADGRYANDAELAFIQDYYSSFAQRLSTYKKMQAVETQMVRAVQAQLQKEDPSFVANDPQMLRKCEFDLLFVLRYAAVALLLNDTDTFKERLLYWLQTIMRTFKNHQSRCDTAYRVAQTVATQYLAPQEATLVCPLLELSRSMLGNG